MVSKVSFLSSWPIWTNRFWYNQLSNRSNFLSPERWKGEFSRPTKIWSLSWTSSDILKGQLFGSLIMKWLNSDFIPRNGKIFEFPKNFIAIWFGIWHHSYAEILGRLHAVCAKIWPKTCYRYRPVCIWQNSFKIKDFSKLKVFADSSWNLAGRSFFSSHNFHPH